MNDSRGLCPYCGQSGLRRWRVRPTNELITLCQECDSVWAFDTPVAKSTSTDFEAFLSAHGLPYDFGLLEAIHDEPNHDEPNHGAHLPTM